MKPHIDLWFATCSKSVKLSNGFLYFTKYESCCAVYHKTAEMNLVSHVVKHYDQLWKHAFQFTACLQQNLSIAEALLQFN